MAGDVGKSKRWAAPRIFSRLRVRLLGFILLILLPAVLLALYTVSEQGRLAANAEQQDALRLAQLAAANQHQLVESGENLLIALSELPTVQAGDTAACNTLFARLAAEFQTYTNIYMVDSNGDTICSGLPTPEGFNVREQRWFQRAMQNKGFNVSDYALGALTRRPVVTLSYPVLDEAGEIRYQIGASLDLRALDRFVTGIQLPAGARLTIIDRNGTILYSYPALDTWIGQPWPDRALVDLVLAQRAGTTVGRGVSDAGERLLGFSPLDDARGSAYIIVSIPGDRAFAEANRLLVQNLAGLGVVALITVAAAWYGTEAFVGRQVKALMDGTARLAAGDLGARVDMRGVENTFELAELASMFNYMAASLEDRQRELEQARYSLEARVQERTAELAFLTEASMILASSLDYETTLTSVAHLAVPQLGDWCAVTIVDGDGAVSQLTVTHQDPEKIEYVRQLQERYPPDPQSPSGTYHVIRTGQPEFYSNITDELLAAAARDSQHLELIRKIGLVSAMTVPLIARGKVLGVMTFATAESGRHYSEDHLRLAAELARRAAQAIDNARLYQEAQQQRQHLRTTLASIGDAVIATDGAGRVTFMNPVAQTLTGWTQKEAEGRPLGDVFRIVNETTAEAVESPVVKVLREGVVVGLANHTILIAKDGTETPIDDSGAPIRDEAGDIIGVILVFRDIAERRQTEAAEREQRALAEALRDTAMALNGALELTEVLDVILGHIGEVVPHDMADVMFIQDGVARIVRSRGFAEQGLVATEEAMNEVRQPVAERTNLQTIVETRLPLTIADVRAYEGWVDIPVSRLTRSYLGVPIIIDGEVIGLINLNSMTPNFFVPEHGQRLQAIADQVAVAIKNAQLYQQAQEAAALEERQRLARDLHDAVSQTLFSANVIAEALPRLWERDPQKGLEKLADLSQLIRGAAAEMRSLLLELRPTMVINTPLTELLIQLADAIKGRKKINIELDLRVDGDAVLPPDVHIALYRIAQESLNNIVKHGQATNVILALRCQRGQAELWIKDNGQGFDSGTRSSGFGLTMMHERAEAVGATLEIDSAIGQGTEVQVRWAAQPVT